LWAGGVGGGRGGYAGLAAVPAALVPAGSPFEDAGRSWSGSLRALHGRSSCCGSLAALPC